MTQLVVPMTHPRVSPIVAALRTLAVGALSGFALGVGARAWMRLIADQPDFTWNGTLFIVIGFTIFGFAQSITAVAARSARHRGSRIGGRGGGGVAGRGGGVVRSLPLFVGAGSIMLPTVVAGGFANARRSWPTPARVVCWVMAGAPVLLRGQRNI